MPCMRDKYIDFRNSSGPITMRDAIPEISLEMAGKLDKGIVFSHPHPLEGAIEQMPVKNSPRGKSAPNPV